MEINRTFCCSLRTTRGASWRLKLWTHKSCIWIHRWWWFWCLRTHLTNGQSRESKRITADVVYSSGMLVEGVPHLRALIWLNKHLEHLGSSSAIHQRRTTNGGGGGGYVDQWTWQKPQHQQIQEQRLDKTRELQEISRRTLGELQTVCSWTKETSQWLQKVLRKQSQVRRSFWFSVTDVCSPAQRWRPEVNRI